MKFRNSPPLTRGAVHLSDGTKEARCHCGHLIARLRKEGVELKCKRCKRIVILPLDGNGVEECTLTPCPA